MKSAVVVIMVKRILATLCVLAILFNLSTVAAAKISSFTPGKVVLTTAGVNDVSVIDLAELEEEGEKRLTLFALLLSSLAFTFLMRRYLPAALYSGFLKGLSSEQAPTYLRVANLRL